MSQSRAAPEPDPFAREVDRLLASLTGPPAAQPASQPASSPSSASGGHTPSRPRARVFVSGEDPRLEVLAVWGRTLLGLSYGMLMSQWPYQHACGWALLGYLAAVALVVLTGAWIGFAAWKTHSAIPHLAGLMLSYWGIVLAAEQLLPRVGYAYVDLGWYCR